MISRRVVETTPKNYEDGDDDDDLDDAMQFVEKMRAGEDLVLAGGLGAGEERESLGGPTWSKVTSLP